MKNIFLLILFFVSTSFGLNSPPTNFDKQHLYQNNFSNPGFETGISPWCKGGSTGSAPTTDLPCSGTTNVTIAASTSSPLAGSKSLVITKPASNEQGDFVGTDLNIGSEQTLKNNTLEFSYSTTGSFTVGTFDGVTPSDIRVYLFDKTTSTAIPVFPNTLDGSGRFVGQYFGTANTNYQLMFWVSTTNASAYTLKIDSLKSKLTESVYISANVDSFPCTITGNWSTNTTYSARCAKFGEYLALEGTVSLTGAPTSASLTINLPTGYTMDVTKVVSGNVGEVNVLDANGSGFKHGRMYYASTTSLSATYASDSTNFSSITQIAPITFATGDNVTFKTMLPIVGWSSGTNTIGQMYQNDGVIFKARKNGGAVSGNITTWTTLDKDNVGGFSLSGGTYTVKSAGDYHAVFSALTTSGTPSAVFYVNGTSYPAYGVTGSQSDTIIATDLKDLKVGDIVTVRIGSLTLITDAQAATWSIHKINDPSALLTINRSSTKLLSSSISANTASITSLNATLIVGKRYKITGSAYLTASNASTNLVFKLTNNSVDVANVGSYLSGSGQTQITPFTNIFTAGATSLVASTSSVTNSSLVGDGTVGRTYYVIEELNNTVEGGL